MSSSESQQEVTDAGVTVDTNNFRRVISLFNEAGELVDPTTRFAIMCAICQDKKLALTNKQLDDNFGHSHEKYAVLPRCGHAFGSDCLFKWVHYNNSLNGREPTCPSCRCSLACPQGHVSYRVPLDSTNTEAPGQSEDIRSLRTALSEDSCAQCVSPREAFNGNDPRVREQNLRIAQASRAGLQDVLREGDRAVELARETWLRAEGWLHILEDLVHDVIGCYHADIDGFEIRNINLEIGQEIAEQQRPDTPYNQPAWDRIATRTAREREVAAQRARQGREDAEMAGQIIREIFRLHGLIEPRYARAVRNPESRRWPPQQSSRES
ncbi:hypothetical protein F5Y07DRAFT_350552 [Xylaria sp. FL0933]|nr:hypothetical protein F5Y07DRAFT_350552 [Xylaria sp. FL0933]